MNKQLDEITTLLQDISSKLGNKWKETIPFCHRFIDLDSNVEYLNQMYPSFYGQSITMVRESSNGLSFQITTTSLADIDDYVWVSEDGRHTLMKVVDISPNGGTNYVNFFLYKLEVA